MWRDHLLSAAIIAPLVACGGNHVAPDGATGDVQETKDTAVASYSLRIDPANGSAELTLFGKSVSGLYQEIPFAADGDPNTNPPGTIQAVTTNPRLPGEGGCPATDNCFTVQLTNFTGWTLTDVFMGVDSIIPPTGRALVGAEAAPAGVTAPGGGRNFSTLADGAASSALAFDIAIPDLAPYTVRGRFWADDAAIIAIGTFTGGDPGEGLDFTGTFPYAVNIRGPLTPTIGDAVFTTDSAPGVTVTAENEIEDWHFADYGATANDDGLEAVMRSIRWSQAPNDIFVNLASITPGARYRLQLLFAESCCTRGFQIFVEGTSIADNFAPYLLQGDTNNTSVGAFVAYEFTAPDDTLNIVLDQPTGFFPDTNPILNALTLEAL